MAGPTMRGSNRTGMGYGPIIGEDAALVCTDCARYPGQPGATVRIQLYCMSLLVQTSDSTLHLHDEVADVPIDRFEPVRHAGLDGDDVASSERLGGSAFERRSARLTWSRLVS